MTHPAMVFAAGFGTRMRPLTDHTPKPLVKINGRPLLDHALDLADKAQANPIVVNAHYLSDQIADHLADKPTILQHESTLLDTGGGLKKASKTLGASPCFTLNSDAIWVGENPLTALAQTWRGDMGALLVIAHVDQVQGRNCPGDFAMDTSNRLSRGGDWVFLGAQLIDPNPAAHWPKDVFSLNEVWDDLIAQRRVYGLPYDGKWCDVGRPENIKSAEAMLNAHNV
ncbi:MAG: nucleotidyltransferase family protein [Pseudomonadota bacterium]